MLPNMDKIIQLESQVVKLTFEISELKNTMQKGLSKGVKATPPSGLMELQILIQLRALL